MFKRFVIIFAIFLMFAPLAPVLSSEYADPSLNQAEIKVVQMKDVPVQNDFSIGPTRISKALKQSEKAVATIEITSRIEGENEFEVGVEDFTSSDDPEKYTIFLGEGKSQYSSKEWFEPAAMRFVLKHGERIYLPIHISVPSDAEPGDHYSSVFVKTSPNNSARPGFNLSSRVGSLFLLRIGEGEIKTAGKLARFSSDLKIYFYTPVSFELNFLNEGDVHLIPSGKIIIANVFGKTTQELEVKDWVVLRNSMRGQSVGWAPRFAMGPYTATATIDRGYSNIVDTISLKFFVIPIKQILIALGGLLVIGYLIRYLSTKFEIKRKK